MRLLRILRGAVLTLGVVLAAFFVFVAVQRLRLPADVEWMTGAVVDHVERVQNGLPLYAAPTADWIPFLYPPLYYWASAFVAHACAIGTACRLVSVASTIASAALIARLARKLGATTYWASVGALCWIGAYAYVGTWFDLERCDALFVAMLLGGAMVLIERRNAVGAAVAGLLFGAAFFAKQQALLVLAGGAIGLWIAGERRRALVTAGVGGGVAIAGTIALNAATGGWFARYCFGLPAAHGMAAKFVTVFFVTDLSKAFLLTGATFALIAGALRQVMRGGDAWSRDAIAFAGLLSGAFVATASSRLHLGGWLNVLMPWVAFACVAVAILASRAEGAIATLVCGATLLQLLHFAYDPMEVAPDASRARDAAALEARVRRLEASGEVIVVGRGHVSAHRHFHSAALVDWVRAGKGIPEDLLAAVRAQRFAAYVFDDKGEIAFDDFLHEPGALFEALLSRYYVAERWDDADPEPLVGWPAHPSWVLRPRRTPLAGLDVKALARRHAIERGLAEARMREAQAGVALPAEDIERAAAAIDTR